jgi:hypothetical protein
MRESRSRQPGRAIHPAGEGHYPGYWVVGAKIKPFTSDYNQASGKLVVWLNQPAPPDTPITFSYFTFGIFND